MYRGYLQFPFEIQIHEHPTNNFTAINYSPFVSCINDNLETLVHGSWLWPCRQVTTYWCMGFPVLK